MHEFHTVRRYALAVLALALAALVRYLLDPFLDVHAPFSTFFAAVAFSALFGGLGPAAVALVGGGLLANMLFMEPRGTLLLAQPDHWVSLALFVLSSAIIVALTERLRSSRAHLAAIVSTAQEAIITKSLDGIVTGWNAGAESMYGYSRDEMLGTPIGRLSPPDHHPEMTWVASRAQVGRSVDALETVRIRKDGRRLDVLLSAAPVRNTQGRVIGVATIERDITERRQIERAHRTTEARLQAIIDNSPMVLFIKDLEGRYILVNRSYAELFGSSTDALIGLTDHDRFSREDADTFVANDQLVARTGQAHEFEEVVEVDGERRTYLSTKFPLRNEKGRVYAVCGLAADITVEKRRQQELVDLDQRKDQFLSMLAHELRNPLAPIANAVHLLRLEEGQASPRVAWAVDVIERQSRHLSRMVDDLLDIARFNTGRIQLRREVVTLNDLVSQSVENLRPRFQSRGVELTVSLPQEAIYVDADAARVVQVVDNLLDNAAKYTDPGGSACLQLAAEDGRAVLRVRDTGIGIARDHLPRVFDLFEQVDESLDRSGGGLGLGLNLVKRMVELHGGTVSARSDGRGQGSEFVVRLPRAARPQAPAVAAAPEQPAPGIPRRVLVIEDNADTARSMELLLGALGHDVQVARNGRRGVAIAEAFNPELVLVDLGLPDIDGYEIARTLRQRFGPSLRLVALTGYGQAQHRQRTREAGFDEHLLKPLSTEALDRALASCG